MRALAHVLCGMVGLMACGGQNDTSAVPFERPLPAEAQPNEARLTETDVTTIIAQAATQAIQDGMPVAIAVVDREGTSLGLLRMPGASALTTVTGGGLGGGIEGNNERSTDVALSKAGTAAFLSTRQNAFSIRTAGFLVQEHYPPDVDPSPNGPDCGVQFSNLRCSDVNRTEHPAAAANLPIGLSADPGGLPLYKEGVLVGGLGIEGDETYTVEIDAANDGPSVEEMIANAGIQGVSPPQGISADRILVNGIRLPFRAPLASSSTPPLAFEQAVAESRFLVGPQGSPDTGFVGATFNDISGVIDPAFPIIGGLFPASGRVTVADVTNIVSYAAVRASHTRSAIRRPIAESPHVSPSRSSTPVGPFLGYL